MKKGYFFVLDAFIAISIIFLGLILMFSFRSQQPYQMQGLFLNVDVIEMLSSTRVYEINNDYVISLYANGAGEVNNTDNTLLEQTAEFYVTDRPNMAETFLRNVTEGSVPEEYGLQLWIYNSTHSYNVTLNSGRNLQNESQTLMVSKKLLVGSLGEEEIIGPFIAEVRIWE